MRAVIALTLAAWLACPATEAHAYKRNPTLREHAQSDIVLFGSPVDAKVTRRHKDWNEGTTDFAIHAVLRDHPALKDKRRIVLPEYIDFTAKGASTHYLAFIDVKGEVIGYCRVLDCMDARMADYVRRVMRLDPMNHPNDLVFYFGRLRDPDRTIQRDANMEILLAGPRRWAMAAHKLDPGELRICLRDPKVPSHLRSTCALALGLHGDPNNAGFVRAMLGRKNPEHPGDLLSASILLGPKEGFAHMRRYMSRTDGYDGRESRLFEAFTAVEFLHEHRRGLLTDEEVISVARLMFRDWLGYLAVDALRRWRLWDAGDAVVALTEAKDYEKNRQMREAVIRFCLRCDDGQHKAKAYLALEVASNPRYVDRVEKAIPAFDYEARRFGR